MAWTALILGFAGSLHCLGMCSPLAIAVTGTSRAMSASRVLYNAGRVFTYGLLGAIVAVVGLAFPMVKYQNLLSIVLGVSLCVVGLAGVSAIRAPFVASMLGGFSRRLKSLFAKFLQQKTHASTFLLGSLNGILPCGLSFLALTFCVTLAGPSDGFMFMILFGVGTLPVMLGFTGLFSLLMSYFSLNMHRVTTTLMILSGFLLIARVLIVLLPQAHSMGEGIDIVLCR